MNQEELKALKERQTAAKKPSIPNNTPCCFALYDVTFSENAKKKAEESERELSFCYDTFTMRLSIMSYYVPPKEGEKQGQWKELIQYDKDAQTVTINDPDINTKAFINMNEYSLKNARIRPPKTEVDAVIGFATVMERDLGIPLEEGINLLLCVAKENGISVSFADLGITSVEEPVWNTVYFTAYRRIKTKEKDGSIYSVIQLWDKEDPIEANSQILSGDISVALLDKYAEMKADETPF